MRTPERSLVYQNLRRLGHHPRPSLPRGPRRIKFVILTSKLYNDSRA